MVDFFTSEENKHIHDVSNQILDRQLKDFMKKTEMKNIFFTQ